MLIRFFSHNLDKVGGKFYAPDFDEFMKHAMLLVSISIEAKKLFFFLLTLRVNIFLVMLLFISGIIGCSEFKFSIWEQRKCMM